MSIKVVPRRPSASNAKTKGATAAKKPRAKVPKPKVPKVPKPRVPKPKVPKGPKGHKAPGGPKVPKGPKGPAGSGGNRVIKPHGLHAPPSVISACALKIAPMRSQLGGPDPSTTGDNLVLVIDPQAAVIAGLLVRLLPGAPGVVSATHVTPEMLAGVLEQYAETGRVYLTTLNVQKSLSDSRLVVWAVQRKKIRQVAQLVRAKIGNTALPAPYRSKLASESAEFLDLFDKEEAIQQVQLQAALKAAKKGSQKVQAVDKKTELLQTMLDLRRGVNVDDATLDQAHAAFQAGTAPGPGDKVH